MDYNIDKITINENYFYISGWIKSADYQIKVIINNKVMNVKNYFDRPDLRAIFKVKMENNYGFDYEYASENKLKKVKVFIISKNDKKMIYCYNNNKINKIFTKLKKIAVKLIKIVRFLWREYKFFVPPRMFCHYIKKLFKKEIQTQIYDPNIKSEYTNWLMKTQYASNKDKLDITCISDTKINIKTIICKNNLSEILKKIDTEYICLTNGKITFVKRFLTELAYQTNSEDLIYFDNDQLINQNFCNPMFKPDWSPDTLLGVNYIGNCIVIKKKLLLKLNIAENNIYKILLNLRLENFSCLHIPKIMYHDGNQLQNNKKELLEYCERNKINIKIDKGYSSDTNIVKYQLNKKPLISIIIPTKDGADILLTCLESIFNKTAYPNYEIIIVDNGSVKKETFELFDKYKKKKNVKILTLNCEFNYSFLNNEAAKISKGEYLLLLNNDIEVITRDWLDIMLGYASQKHVGAVGVKLLFPDNTIQHAGVIMGKGGLAGHAHYMKDMNYLSSQYELKIPYNYSVCTAACLMVSKKKFFSVGGLEEKLKVAFNDVDFNLKLIEKNLYNVFLPNVVLYHHESKSRGLDNTVEKQKRFEQEFYFMVNKWSKHINNDKFYNYNFSRVEDYKLEVRQNEKKN